MISEKFDESYISVCLLVRRNEINIMKTNTICNLIHVVLDFMQL